MIFWETKDEQGSEAELYKYEEGDVKYEFVIEHSCCGESAAIHLDRKQLKDLFHALGDELKAF